MTRIAVNILAVLLAVMSFALAQDEPSIEDQVNAQLSSLGIDPATATDEQNSAAFDAVVQAQIAAELGGDIAGATDDEIAAAVNALIASNPSLSDNTVGALAAAATKLRPSAATTIASQAASARPSAAGTITFNVGTAAIGGLGAAQVQTMLANIAVAVAGAAYTGDNPAVVGEIAAAASTVFSLRQGYAAYPYTVISRLGTSTGLGYGGVMVPTRAALGSNPDAALMNGSEYQVNTGNLGNEFFLEDAVIIQENPAQDVSPT